MARGSRIVDGQNVVQPVDDFYIAYNGQSMQVASAFVANNGQVCQFWPSTVIAESGIVLENGTTEETFASGPAPQIAGVVYDARTGQLYFNDGDSDTYRIVEGINPAPRTQGAYLFKFDIVSGDIVADDPEGVWVDVNSEGTLGVKFYYLKAETVGQVTAQGTVSLAEDDGAGGPLAGTEVSITVNFVAEVQPDRISMTTRQWNLDNVEYNERAEVAVVVVPDEWYDAINNVRVTEAYITGEYGAPKGTQEVEIYTPTWGPDITVKADIISGGNFDARSSEFGVELSTQIRRLWVLTADDAGEIKNATIDITISDGIYSVTKRVAMRAENRVEGVPPGSGIEEDFTEQLNVDDYVFFVLPQPPRFPGGRIEVYRVGNMDAFYVSDGSQIRDNYPQKWHLESPAASDPQNYEGRMFRVSGAELTTNIKDVWQNLNDNRIWELAITSQEWAARPAGLEILTKTAEYILEIREAGRPETDRQKRIIFNLILEENVNDLAE